MNNIKMIKLILEIIFIYQQNIYKILLYKKKKMKKIINKIQKLIQNKIKNLKK